MSDFDLSLKISTLVDGTDAVDGLSKSIDTLGQEAKTLNDAGTTAGKGIAATGEAAGSAKEKLDATGESAQSLGEKFADMGVDKLKESFLELAAALGIADLFDKITESGIEYNKMVETSTINVAAAIAAQRTFTDAQGEALQGTEQFANAQELAAEQIEKLHLAAASSLASVDDLTKNFQRALNVGLNTQYSLDDIRTLTVSLTNAATALGVPTRQVGIEIQGILTGQIQNNSKISEAIGLTNAQLAQYKASGTLIDGLNSRLAQFNIAGQAALNTFAGAEKQGAAAFENLSGQLTGGLLDQLKGGIQDSLGEIFQDLSNFTLSPDFAVLVQDGKDLYTYFGVLLRGAIDDVVGYAKDLGAYLAANRTDVDGIADSFKIAAGTVGDLVKSILEGLAALVALGVESGAFKGAIELAGLAVAAIEDGFRAIVLVVAEVGAEIVNQVISPVQEFIAGLQLVASAAPNGQKLAATLGDANKSLQDIKDSTKGFANSLADPFLNGTNAVAKYNAALKAADAARAQNEKNADLAAIYGQGGRAAGGGGSGTPNHGNENKQAAATAAARLALIQAELAAEAAVQTAAYANANKNLADSYKQGLITTQDYYDAQTAIALAANQTQINLKQNQIAATNAAQGQLGGNATAADVLKIQTQRAKLEGELNVLIVQRGQIETTEAAALRDANQSNQDALRTAQGALDALKGDPVAAAMASAVTQYRQALILAGQLSGADHDHAVQVANDTLAAKAQLATIASLQTQISKAKSDADAQDVVARATINASNDTDLNKQQQLAALDAQKIADLNVEIGLLQKQQDAQNNIGNSDAAAQIGDQIAQIRAQTIQLQSQLEPVAKQIQDDFSAAFSDLFKIDDNSSDSLATRIRSFFSTIFQDVGNLAGKQLTQEIFNALTSSTSDSSGVSSIFKTLAGYITGNGGADTGTAGSIVGSATSGITGATTTATATAQTAATTASTTAVGVLTGAITDAAAVGEESAATVAEAGSVVVDAIVDLIAALQENSASAATSGAGSAAGGASGIAGLFSDASGYAGGGEVHGPGTSTSDSIMARLSRGEFVVKAAAVKQLGTPFLHALNGSSWRPRTANFAGGGLVAGQPPAAGGGGNVRVVNVYDPSLAGNYLSSAEGEKMVLNILERNSTAVKQFVQ